MTQEYFDNELKQTRKYYPLVKAVFESIGITGDIIQATKMQDMTLCTDIKIKNKKIALRYRNTSQYMDLTLRQKQAQKLLKGIIPDYYFLYFKKTLQFVVIDMHKLQPKLKFILSNKKLIPNKYQNDTSFYAINIKQLKPYIIQSMLDKQL